MILAAAIGPDGEIIPCDCFTGCDESFWEYLDRLGFVPFAMSLIIGFLAIIIIRCIAKLFEPKVSVIPYSEWTYLALAGFALLMSFIAYMGHSVFCDIR